MPGLGGFSRYELQERIGIGGMAEVFRARAFDASGTSRDVVVKKILPHHNDDADFRSMFMDEARIAANLDHPNVVRVLDLGRLDGDLFLTMEYVDGTDLLRLSEWMEGAGRTMPIATALHLGCEVLKGLHHAHTRVDAMGRPLGIVHRDVTPQNVLVGAQGAVKLTDFGIARAANRLSHTTVGTIKGNLHYSSPEQISSGAVDARADVYSCGILLHRLLGGRHPFEGDDLPKIYQRALSGDIPPVSASNKSVPTNLDRIIARATALVPEQRFASADELRLALEEFVRGKRMSVDLKALCADVRAKKSGLRAASKPDGRVLFTESADEGSVLRTIEPATGAAPSAPPLDDDDAPTTVQRLPELRDADPTARAPIAPSPAKSPSKPIGEPIDEPGAPRLSNLPRQPARTPAQRAIDDWGAEDKTSRVPAPAGPARPEAPEVEEEGTAKNPIPKRASEPLRIASTILEPKAAPSAPPPAGGGTPMLSSRPPVVAPDPDAAPTMFAELPPPTRPPSEPEGEVSAATSPGLSPLVRDALGDSVPPEPRPPAQPLAPTPETRRPSLSPRPMAAPPELVVPVAAPPPAPVETPIPALDAPPPVVRPGGSPRGRTPSLAPTPAPPWEQPAATRQPGATPPPAQNPSPTPPPWTAPVAAPSPLALWDDPRAAVAPVASLVPPGEATIDLDDAPAVLGALVDRPAPAPPSPQPAAAGSWLSGSRSAPGGVREVDWPELPGPPLPGTPAPVAPAPASSLPVPGPAGISPVDLGTAFDDVVESNPAAARQREAAFAQSLGLGAAAPPSWRLEGHLDAVTAVAAVRGGRYAVSASHDRTLRVWDLEKQAPVSVLQGHTGVVTSVALAGDGRRVISGSVDQAVCLWDSESGLLIASMTGHVEAVLAVAIAPDGRTAISGGQDKSVRVWDLAICREQTVMSGHEQAVSSLAYSGDGTIAMSASLDGLIQIWNLLDGSMLAMFPTGVLGLRAIAISRDGRRLVFGGSDGTVQVWNVDKGTPIFSFEAHKRAVLSIALSPDGMRIATAGDDGYVRLFDSADGKARIQLESGAGSVHSIAFALDGRSLIGAAGKRVCVWDLPQPE